MTESPDVCVQIVVPYETRVDLGQFPEGTYRLTVADAQSSTSLVFAVRSGEAPPADAPFLRGDANQDGTLDISDAVAALLLLFLGGDPSSCLDAVDANDDGQVDVSDPIWLLGFLFGGGHAPREPFTACGTDPTADALGCGAHAGCP